MKPKVSIVTPLYNSSAYIQETIESVVGQTCQNWELILVDDGSTDDTRLKVEPFLKDARLKYTWQENRGIAGARNTGISVASGEWICLLDHDDRWLPEKLEKQLAFAEANACDIVSSDAWVVRGEGRTLYSEIFPPGLESALARSPDDRSIDVFEWLIKGNFICSPSVMIRRSIFESLGLLDEDAAPADDYEMWLRCMPVARVGYLPEPLVEYHIHEQNYSRDQLRMLKKEIFALNKTRATAAPAYRELLDRRIVYLRRMTARDYLDQYHRVAQTGPISQAWPFLREALQLAPSEVLRPKRLLAVLRRGAYATFRRA